MKLRLIAVGTRMPEWVSEGFENYQKRLPIEYKFELISIPPSKRSKSSHIPSLIAEEEKKYSLLFPNIRRSLPWMKEGNYGIPSNLQKRYNNGNQTVKI